MGVDAYSPPELHVVGVLNVDLTWEATYRCDGYDVAICLEVVEHLDPIMGPKMIDGLARARRVLFSGATPGQPGVDHVNCRPHDYWHGLFAQHKMHPTHVGPLFAGTSVADFYQRNMYLYERPA